MSKNSQLNSSLKGLTKAQIDDLAADRDSEESEWNLKTSAKNKTKVIRKIRKTE